MNSPQRYCRDNKYIAQYIPNNKLGTTNIKIKHKAHKQRRHRR